MLEQARGLHSDVAQLTEEKVKQWDVYTKSIESREYSKALEALRRVIEIKKRILEKLKSREEILRRVLDILNQA
jgi:hypothetical protein